MRGELDMPGGERSIGSSQEVRRTAYASSSPVEDMRVDHRGADVLVPEEFLDRPVIIPILQEMGSERMPEGVAGDGFLDTGPLARALHRPLDDGVVEVVSEESTGRRFRELSMSGKYPLPSQLAVRGLVLPLERFRKCNVPAPLIQIPFVPLLHFFQVTMQAGLRLPGEDGHPVPVSLSLPYQEIFTTPRLHLSWGQAGFRETGATTVPAVGQFRWEVVSCRGRDRPVPGEAA